MTTMLAVLAGCGEEAEQQASSATLVDTVMVRAMDVPATIEAAGTVEADHATTVEPEVSGRVVGIVADEGTRVSAGAPVIQLDPGAYRDGARSAAADLSRARATLSADAKLLERYDRLLEAGAIDQQTYDNQEATVASGRAAVEQAEARLATARRDLGDATVRAPFGGVVGKRHVQLGEYVSTGGGGQGGGSGNGGSGGLFDLIDAQPVRVRFSVPETHIDEVEPGDRIRFRVRSDTVATRVAEVDYVSPRIDSATRTFEVRATYSNPDLEVRPGAFAEVELVTAIHSDAAVVPEEAIVTEGSDNFVYVVRDSTASRRRIQVGARFDGLVEVTDGLEPGSAVITAGQQGLTDGAVVRVRPGRDGEQIQREG